jgi:hypothetical protein
LGALEATSPEVVRERIKALIRQITVKPDGSVLVEGTYEPLVREELERAGAEGPMVRHPHSCAIPLRTNVS